MALMERRREAESQGHVAGVEVVDLQSKLMPLVDFPARFGSEGSRKDSAERQPLAHSALG